MDQDVNVSVWSCMRGRRRIRRSSNRTAVTNQARGCDGDSSSRFDYSSDAVPGSKPRLTNAMDHDRYTEHTWCSGGRISLQGKKTQ